MSTEKKDYHELGRKDGESGGSSNPPHEKGMVEELTTGGYSKEELSDREDYRHGHKAGSEGRSS